MGWIPAAAVIAGTAISAYGSIRAGYAASNAAQYNAQMARYEKDYALKKSEFEEQQHRRDVARFMGEQVVSGAKAGYTGAGSDITPLLETAKAGELDAALIRYGGAIDAWRYGSEANLSKYMAGEYKTAGFLQAGGTILNTVGRWDWKKSFGQQETGSLLKSNKYRWAPRTASGL